MSAETTITLNDHFKDFIAQKVNSGSFKNATDVIQKALKLLENHDSSKQELIDALILGEESGISEDFNPEKNLKNLHSKHV